MSAFEINVPKDYVVLLLMLLLKFCETTILLSTTSSTNTNTNIGISNPNLGLLQIKSNISNMNENTSKYGLNVTRQQFQSLYTNIKTYTNITTTTEYELNLKANNTPPIPVPFDTKREKENRKPNITQTSTKEILTTKHQSDKTLDSKTLSHKTTYMHLVTIKSLINIDKDINTNPVKITNQSYLSQQEENVVLKNKHTVTRNKTRVKENANNIDKTHEQQITLHTNTTTKPAKNISKIQNKDIQSKKVTYGTTFGNTHEQYNLNDITRTKRGITLNTSTQGFQGHKIKSKSSETTKIKIGSNETTKRNEVKHYGQDDVKRNRYKSYLLLLSHWTKKKDIPEKYIDWSGNNKLVEVEKKVPTVFNHNLEIEDNRIEKKNDYAPLVLNDFYRSLPEIKKNRLGRNKDHKTPFINRSCKPPSKREDSLWSWMLRENNMSSRRTFQNNAPSAFRHVFN